MSTVIVLSPCGVVFFALRGDNEGLADLVLCSMYPAVLYTRVKFWFPHDDRSVVIVTSTKLNVTIVAFIGGFQKPVSN